MTTLELNRMKKYAMPYVYKGSEYLVVDGEVEEGVLVIDLMSHVVAPITKVYVDGSFLAPTAFDASSPTGFGEHRFVPHDFTTPMGVRFFKQ